MAVNHATDDYVLPCERRLDDIWQRVEQSPDEHEQTCPHCTAARQSLLVLRDATRQLAEEPVPQPVGLTGRIMAAVRADIRRGRMLPLPSTSGDISEQAVAVVLRFAADSVPGVRARRCTVRATDTGAVEIELSLALRYGGTAPAERMLAQVRERVADAAEAGIGLRVARCDLVLADLYS
jgi:hypothetical protein